MRAARQIIIFLVVVIGIVLLLSLVFGGNKNTNKQPTVQKITLVDFAKRDSQVVSITDGVINGDDEHRAIRITVDRNTRTMDVIQGYQGNVIASQSYVNNQQAYAEFLSALAKASFASSRKTSLASENGVCATGRRYVFELLEANKSISRTWTANCVKGNTNADPARVTKLFRNQITDYDKLMKGQSL